MTVNISILAGAGWQFFSNNGVTLSGGKIYTYLAGTTTPATTYTTLSGNVAQSNPIILNSAGRLDQELWLDTALNYKFLLKDSTDVLIGTYDNLYGVASAETLANFLAQISNTSNIAQGDALVGFKQANSTGVYTGAVGKTVHDKLQDIVSVYDFGATGTGTTDDTVAIQAALNSGAQQIYFPSGTFLVSSQGTYVTGDGYCLTVPSNVTIQGAGIGAQILLHPNIARTSIFDVMGTAVTQLITTWENGGVPSDNYEQFILNAPDIGCVFTAGNSLDAIGAGSATTNIFSVVAGRRYRVSFRLVQNFGTTPNKLLRMGGTIDSPSTIGTYVPTAGTNEFEFTATNETHFVFTNSVGQQVNYTVYAFLIEDLSVPTTNKKQNITINGLRFVCDGDQTAYLVRARWIDDLTLNSNECYGCGLLYAEELSYNTIAMNGGVTALNQDWLISNNRIFGYDSTKTQAARSGPGMSIDGIFFTNTNNAKILNNWISDIHWGIYGNGGPGNPGTNGSDIKNTRYCIGATISNNTVINGASGGIWWAMCDRFVVSNNWLSTIDDVGLEPEGSSNCLIEGNYCEHGPSIMAQQRSAMNIIWKNNHVFQDGLLRGYWLKQRNYVLFSDSAADEGALAYRQLFLFGNTFHYEQGDILADETGRVAPSLLFVTNIDSNTFINTRLDGVNSSTAGFSFTNNTLLFTGAFSGGASAVSPYTDPYRNANYSDVFTAVDVPNAGSISTYTPDIPMRVYNNRIDAAVTVPAGSIGIDIPLGASGLANSPYLLDFNRVSSKFAIGISFVGGGVFGTTFLFKNNTVESIRDYTWQYASDPAQVTATTAIYESNKKNSGLDLIAAIPTVGKFSVPMQFWYASPVGNYAGVKLISSGATYKETWSSLNAYVVGEQVLRTGQVYISIQNSTNQDPVTATAYWSLYNATPAVWREMALMI